MTQATRYRFDFSDLVAPTVELRVLEGGVDVPAARIIEPAWPRPGWLGRLLPLFPAGRGLRLAVSAEAAPTFGTLLLDSLAGLLSAAGSEAGLRVASWEGELLVDSGAIDRMPLQPHFHLVAADLVAGSMEKAALYLSILPPERTLLLLNGRMSGIQRRLAIPTGTQVRRMPMVGRAELDAAAAGRPPGLGSRRFGRACLEVAREVVQRYREQL